MFVVKLKCPYVDKSLGIIVHVNIGSRRIVMFVKAAEVASKHSSVVYCITDID